MMPIPSSDDFQPDTDNDAGANASSAGNNVGSKGSRRLSQEISTLQQEIREDFDQKLRELSSLMHKFKALVAGDERLKNDLSNAANQAFLNHPPDNSGPRHASTDHIPVLTDRVEHTDGAADKHVGQTDEARPASVTQAVARPGTVSNQPTPINQNDQTGGSEEKPAGSETRVPGSKNTNISRFPTEPARFESGLYQLNSQLYRFKLELDQEMEFREEPLHMHFHHQSELARVLKQITEKMQRERNIGR